MATWSTGFLLEFIEEFRGHPSIWKVKSKENHNREKEESAYSTLTKKVKTNDPQANKETVLKKINNLHSSLRKERKKVLMAKKSGMSSEDLMSRNCGTVMCNTCYDVCNLLIIVNFETNVN
ncbi:hypothetical protein B7P43_G03281 [Cryptotermes secundus]|uniref:MADF domain-containing protein n=1 Tax=Cryptotermes secundus TaxID=105785 RepID=A0A2J7PIJ6_9NEOP|nr:hypothetical protein B7P43_G03281 [Cryptotermes secundus]